MDEAFWAWAGKVLATVGGISASIFSVFKLYQHLKPIGPKLVATIDFAPVRLPTKFHETLKAMDDLIDDVQRLSLPEAEDAALDYAKQRIREAISKAEGLHQTARAYTYSVPYHGCWEATIVNHGNQAADAVKLQTPKPSMNEHVIKFAVKADGKEWRESSEEGTLQLGSIHPKDTVEVRCWTDQWSGLGGSTYYHGDFKLSHKNGHGQVSVNSLARPMFVKLDKKWDSILYSSAWWWGSCFVWMLLVPSFWLGIAISYTIGFLIYLVLMLSVGS